MIVLGDKISLDGFDDLNPASLVVVKKMIGSLARSLAEEKGYDRLEIVKIGSTIYVKSAKEGKSYEGESSEENIFFGLSRSFDQMKGMY
ncbi:MAG: hypothetical protein AABY09_03275 [Nanoarchaeota archaeon]